ncbi:MAG TPA: hypothetical protein VJM50_19045, partial [Pyrinomonadaceae bacterium]|nr:hypothetical protein [Pyrinomonadaceae bacterium]
MTRKILLFAFLGVALAIAILFPFANSDASRALPDKSMGLTQSVRSGPLPDYDIRLAGKGEFTDYDLSSASAKPAGLNVAVQARAAAIARFRSKLNSDVAQKLRAKANETGAIKNLFIEGATLSDPRSDTADNIARGFLGRNTGLFALRSADAGNLRLINEDNDRGTSFLEYAQIVGGLKVFEGRVQVVVNRNGEVLSVREGFLIDGQTADLIPAVDENQAIVKAFGYAGRSIDSSLVETRGRGEKSESAAFANPLGTQLEDVISELNVLRVGNSAKLAWHIYAEVGPDEWYESLVDAHSGELLLRHNLYVFEAQGTVFTEAPDKGAR